MSAMMRSSGTDSTKIRDLLAEGLLLALPLGAAAYLLVKTIGAIKKVLVPVAHLLPNGHLFGIAAIEIAAIILMLLGLMVLGLFSRSNLGHRIAITIEHVVLSKIPGYLVVKNIAADLTNSEDGQSMRPVLVSLDDNTVLGFVVEESTDAAQYTIFLPGAPGAASGSVMLVPRERIRFIDAETGRAMRTMKQRGIGLQALAEAGTDPRNQT